MQEFDTHTVIRRDRFLAAFSHREMGNQSFTYGHPVDVHANRRHLLDALGITDKQVYFARLSHSTNLAVLGFIDNNTPQIKRTFLGKRDVQPSDMEIGFDGYFSFDAGWYVGFSLGDCVPLYVWEENSGLFGLIHAGLLGTINQIVLQLTALYTA